MSDIFLLLDIGNTRIKAALADPSGPLRDAALAVPTGSDASVRLADGVRALCAARGLDPRALADAVACSVVPALNGPLAAALAGVTGRAPLLAPADLPFGFANAADIPPNVGADRLAGCFGALRAFPDAARLVVIDFGTATTVDCVHDSAYLGGLTCPGLVSAARSMAETTAQLPLPTLELDGPELRLGFDTMRSLNQGLMFGFAGLAEGLAARLEALLGGPALVVATGGPARDLAALAPRIERVEPALVMHGLLAARLERA